MSKREKKSILDKVCKTLDKLEDKVIKKFDYTKVADKEVSPLELHHNILLDIIIFRMLSRGYTEDEMYHLCNELIKENTLEKKELDEKELSEEEIKTIH